LGKRRLGEKEKRRKGEKEKRRLGEKENVAGLKIKPD
jgi:hypothetical protein